MGFVLAAGLGERLRPLTDLVPKPLTPVMNVPALVYSLMLLREAGIEEVVVNLHHLPGAIRDYLESKNRFGFKIHYSPEKEILGTGGGVKKCEHLLGGGDFALVNGDIVSDIDLRKLIDRHRAAGSAGTLGLCRTGAAGPVSVKDGRVADFKNFLGTGLPGALEYTGVAVLSPEIFRHLERGPSSIVYTGYTALVKHTGLDYYEHRGFWRDLGTVESYREASMALLEDDRGLGARLSSAMGVEMRAVDEEAQLMAGAKLRRCVAGAGCVVGENAEVRDSVLLPGSVVRSGAVVEKAVVCGERALAAGP